MSDYIRTLLDEIIDVQIKDAYKDYQLQMKKEVKRKIISCVAVGLCGISCFASSFLFHFSIIPFIVGNTVLYFVVRHIVDEENKKKNSIANMVDEDPLEKNEFLFLAHTDERYYTKEYKEVLEYWNGDDVKKYNDALEKQKEKKNESTTSSNVLLREVLDKDASIKKVEDEIEIYYHMYTLPESLVSVEEWILFTNALYDFFDQKGLTQYFYGGLSAFVRYVLANVLVHESSCIRIKDLIDCLPYFQNEILKISSEDVQKLQTEITEKLRENKVVDIGRYRGKVK